MHPHPSAHRRMFPDSQVMRDNAPETVRDALRREIIQLIESSRRTEEGCALSQMDRTEFCHLFLLASFASRFCPLQQIFR